MVHDEVFSRGSGARLIPSIDDGQQIGDVVRVAPSIEDGQQVATKAFFNAESVDFKWEARGRAVLVRSSTAVRSHCTPVCLSLVALSVFTHTAAVAG